MKAVVIGGTGATGKKLIENLVQRSWIDSVVALVRHPALIEHPKLEQVVVDFDHLEDYAQYINGDVAFSCLGTTLKIAGSKKAQWHIDYDYQYQFAQIARENNIHTFVLMSALGASPNSMIFYNKMKGQLEVAVKQLDFKKLIIAKPSLLIRSGADDRAGENIGLKVIGFFNNLGLLKGKRPLKVSIVANAMVSSVQAVAESYKELNVEDILKLNEY